jgi:hypothetical protein
MDKNGIAYLLDCCNAIGIKSEEVFCLGTGKTYNVRKGRFEFKVTNFERSPSHKFAIKYFSQHDFYLCWDLMYCKQKQKVFTVSKDKVFAVLESGPDFVEKAIEYRGRGTGRVFVVTYDKINDFLKTM